MTTAAMQRLQDARASLFAAESAIAVERAVALQQQLTDAVAEARRIGDEIAEHGKRLFMAEQNFQELWEKRKAVANELKVLREALPDFPLVGELQAYEKRSAELQREWDDLSKQLSVATIPSAQERDTIDKLKAAKHRTELGISDLRLAVRESQTGFRQIG